MVVFGDSGSSAAVSSQLYIVNTYESHRIKGEPWKSLIKTAAPKCRQVPETTATPPPLSYNAFHITILFLI